MAKKKKRSQPNIDVRNIDYLELLSTLPDQSVDCVITDPPYGINYQNPYTNKRHEVITNDEREFSYRDLARECYRVMKPNSAIFCFTGWSTYPQHFHELSSAGFRMKEPLIGQKKASGTHDLYGSFQSNCDWCMFAHKGKFRFKPTQLIRNKKAGIVPAKGRKPTAEWKTRMPSVWFGENFPWSSENSAIQSSQNINHPTIKGLMFTQWLIQLSTDIGGLVCDPFVGSGTTAVGCQLTNRKFVGSEINQDYYNLTLRRLGNGQTEKEKA